MLKQLVVEVNLPDNTAVILELAMKGDGIVAVHSYSTESHYRHSHIGYKLFMKNEDGEKNVVMGDVVEKEGWMKMLQQGMHIHNLTYEHDFTDQKHYFEPGSPGFREYDQNLPFIIEGLGTPGTIITLEQADEIVKDYIEYDLKDQVSVEDSEINQLGYVYTLDNGEALVVRGSGTVHHIKE